MEITIGGTCYDYRTDYQDDKNLRGSFDTLARETFGLSFEPWYLSGNWTDRYRPYSLLHKGQVVANVSVSPMDLRCMGRELHCVQLGTVMTAPAFRGRGLGRALLERVEAEGRARGAARLVLDTFSFQAPRFYEKLGYRRFGQVEPYVNGYGRYYYVKTL